MVNNTNQGRNSSDSITRTNIENDLEQESTDSNQSGHLHRSEPTNNAPVTHVNLERSQTQTSTHNSHTRMLSIEDIDNDNSPSNNTTNSIIIDLPSRNQEGLYIIEEVQISHLKQYLVDISATIDNLSSSSELEKDVIIRFRVENTEENRVILSDEFLQLLVSNDISGRLIVDCDNINIVNDQFISSLFRYLNADERTEYNDEIIFRNGDRSMGVCYALQENEMPSSLHLISPVFSHIHTQYCNEDNKVELTRVLNNLAICIVTTPTPLLDMVKHYAIISLEAIDVSDDVCRDVSDLINGIQNEILSLESAYDEDNSYSNNHFLELARDSTFDKLTDFSKTYPGESFSITFMEEEGQDEGGLSKEALTLAYSQAINYKIINKDQNDPFTLSTLSAVNVQSSMDMDVRSKTIDKFEGFGHLLAMSLNEKDYKTHHSLADSIFDQIITLKPYCNATSLEYCDDKKVNKLSNLVSLLLESPISAFQSKNTLLSLVKNSVGRDALLSLLQDAGKNTQRLTNLEEATTAIEKSFISRMSDEFWTSSFKNKMSDVELNTANLFILRLAEACGCYIDDIDPIQDFGKEIIMQLGEELAPRLAVANGFFEVHYDLEVDGGSELQTMIIDTSSYRDKMEGFSGDKDAFFSNYFTVSSRFKGDEIALDPEVENRLKNYIIYYIENSTPEELQAFLMFATSTRAISDETKLNFVVQLNDTEQANVAGKLPEAHTCFNAVDIPLDMVLNDKENPSDFFYSE